MARKAGINGFGHGGFIAVLTSGLLVMAFQACASSPKSADSPTTPEAASSTAASLESPPPSSTAPAPTAVLSESEPPQPLPASEPQPDAEHHPDVCEKYEKIQQPLARLGIEALKAGRIDPWIYELDAETGNLRLNKLIPFPKTVRSALKAVNADPYAAKVLSNAYQELTKPGQFTVCTPTTYSAKLTQESDPKTGGEWVTWEFSGDVRPNEMQMVGCYRALYGKVPKGCDVASFAEVAAKCMVVTSGFVQEGDCPPAADAMASNDGKGIAAGAKSSDGKSITAAAKKGCCKHCSGVYYSSSCSGSCS